MNVLLVMPKTGYLWDEWATPPIGIAYVSSYLKKHGVQVYTVNMNLEDDDIETVLKKQIQENHIDILGTGELVVNYEKLQEIAYFARKIKPDLKIWVGGGLVTNSPIEAMNLIPEADYGMVGEGEATSLELVRFLEKGCEEDNEEEIKKIDGLVVRRADGSLFLTQKRADIMELDAIPFPDWSGFELVETCRKYAKEDGSIVAPVVSSRSCPNSCTFCSKSGGKKYRRRSLENIFAEIDELVNLYHVNKLNFNDELFANNTERLYQFCDRIEKYHITYRISMHIGKNLTLELLKRMKQSGCSVIFYGLESADDNVLKSMRKHITLDEIERCLKITKQAGITAEGNFIFGDPVETKESVQKTLSWIEHNYTMGLFEVAPIKLYPGSQLYEDALISGKIQNPTEFIREKCPLLNVSALTDEEYADMVNRQLTAVQEIRLQPQKNLKLFSEHGIKGVTICSNCGKQMEFQVKDMSAMLRMYTQHCEACGGMEYLNLFPSYYDAIKEKLNTWIKNRKVAIFGCGNIWKMFYMAGEIFQNGEYLILDETPYLQKNGWNGRKVYPPAYIREHKVDIVIGMIRISLKEMQEKFEKQYQIKDAEYHMIYDML